jgi:molybdopterin-binding protein
LANPWGFGRFCCSRKEKLLGERSQKMKLSARNQIKGVIKSVTKGQTTAHVQIDIGGVVVSASITNEAVDELKLASGQTAYAVIKASDVMVAID